MTEPRRRSQASSIGSQKEHATARICLRPPVLANAVARVHSALASIHGVSAVMVSLESQEAFVHLDLHQVSLLQFKRALSGVGVTVEEITVSFDQKRAAAVPVGL